MDTTLTRCDWVPLGDPLYVAYHDEEWGVPSHDDRHLFELLTLEGAQAGLSWSTCGVLWSMPERPSSMRSSLRRTPRQSSPSRTRT